MIKNKLIASLMAVTFMTGASVTQAADTTTENPLPQFTDPSRVTLNGQIAEVREDEFDLNYGSGIITVELESWGWDEENMSRLRQGDSVTVSGIIDDDLFEGREIEADNVYLNREFVFFAPMGANASEGTAQTGQNSNRNDVNNFEAMEDGSYLTLTGTVTAVDGDDFTLNTGTGSMKIDTDELDYDPFDEDGLQKLQQGDRVQVYGEIDEDFFESKKLEADRIVTLSQSQMSRTAQ